MTTGKDTLLEPTMESSFETSDNKEHTPSTTRRIS